VDESVSTRGRYRKAILILCKQDFTQQQKNDCQHRDRERCGKGRNI